MGQVNFPIALGAAFWDKQKAALAKLPKAPATKLPDELKTLTKLHLAIGWNAFGDDKLNDVDEAQSRLSDLDVAAKGKLKALAEQAQAVETAASKFEADAKKDKAFPKEPLVAAAAVAKAAKQYRADLEQFVAAAHKSLVARVAALAAHKPKASQTGSAAPGTEPASAKLLRTRGLDAIRRIKTPRPGDPPMRFIVVQGKLSVATYMGPSVGPAQENLLKSLIPTEMPFKVFKDPLGTLTWERNSLTFVSDVLPAGVVKKMQSWLKNILRLNLKLRVRRTSGDVEESEGEDILDDRDLGEIIEAGSELDEIESLIEAGGQPDGALASVAPAPAAGPEMTEWKARRAAAVNSLKVVATRIGKARHPSSSRAIVEIQGVLLILGAEPSTLQQVSELERYLGQDDVVSDVCELIEDIRTPLLRALDQLRVQIGA